jgi:hypothetical protein
MALLFPSGTPTQLTRQLNWHLTGLKARLEGAGGIKRQRVAAFLEVLLLL